MLVIYAAAFLFLWMSAGWWSFKWIGSLCLICQVWSIWRFPYPHYHYEQITYKKAISDITTPPWLLISRNGKIQDFTEHHILLEVGLFFLLELYSNKDDNRKVLVIFFDQLPTDTYRCLRILEKITR